MHLSKLVGFLVSATLLQHATAWEGINCKGSGFCGKRIWGGLGDEHRDGARSTIDHLRTYVMTQYRQPGCRTPPGEHFVCRANFQGGICAALQHSPGGKNFPVAEVHKDQGINAAPGLNKSQIIDALTSLIDYGCKVCGSVPVGYPHNNDPDAYGVVTVNYVHFGMSPYPNGVQYDCESTPDENYYSNPFNKNDPKTDKDGY